MNSGTDLAGTDGFTTMTEGYRMTLATGRNVADEIVVELVVQCRVDRVETTDHKQRVAVRRCAHDRLGADIAAATRSVLDDELLAQALRQPLTHQASEDVGRTGRSG